ncbi:sensor histidine kinase [Agromyces sp. Leaf222]|uniref:sensor histidine kinase n=1 Tax=Agromyces sp. Leaf222 TaxID=1735688 RepID=UPI0006F69B95|nr:sensor histidine kinase [Agromyces sp. Leaf222]KQM84673.1 histidine kinase [Agromyces sp. Leaf222]
MPFSGPRWPIMPPSSAGPLTTFPAVLVSRGARSWYFGAGVSLLWLIGVGDAVIAQSSSTWSAVVGVALVVVFAVAFLVAAPLGWSLTLRGRRLVALGFFALSFTLMPWLGWEVCNVWTYVGVLIAVTVLPWRETWTSILALGGLSLLLGYLTEGWHEHVLSTPAIIISISLMMAAFARTLAAMNQLRATQAQLESMAVERERGRVARDLHDILGHSLTVITVKAELAGRLVEADPARARSEIGQVEQLARGALADVRATVAGFRGVNVSTELLAARSALEAAGIEADLPRSTDAVPEPRRELAGWIVREGVTNVIRHSGASRCRVRLASDAVEVADDGFGPSAASAGSNGLAGLRERVEAAGGTMTVGRGDLGGFTLRVAL